MLHATAGQLAVNAILPEDLRDYNRVLDKKGVARLLQDVAEKYPEKYRQIAHDLSRVGYHVAYLTGGNSFGLRHLRGSVAGQKTKLELTDAIHRIYTDPSLDDVARETKVVKLLRAHSAPLEEANLKESLAEKNPLAIQVLSGARGNAMNLRSLRAGDLLYVDHHDEPIPVPILNSYSHGLSPVEYFAGTFGARKGVSDTKFATQEAGFFSKQLNQIAHRLVVAAQDHGQEPAGLRGLPVAVTDPDNEGALLAAPAGGYPRNTVLTPKILDDLHGKGLEHILVRSPLVGGHESGGLLARDLGIRERGGLPPVGDFVGIAAAQALSEPLAQAQLCLGFGTLVRMADWAVRKVEEVTAGEYVLGADRSGKTFPVRVLAVHRNGPRDCVRTRFRVASTSEFIELCSTPDHKLLATARYWVLPRQKKVTDVLPVGEKCVGYGAEMTTAVEHAGGRPEPFALLLGLLLGDGCYTDSVHGVHLSCFDPLLIRDVTPYLDSLGLRAKLLAGQRGYFRISQQQDRPRQDPDTGRMLPGARNPALVKLQSYAMHGKYAHEKQIPEDVWGWDQRSVTDLVAGLFVTDGSVYVNEANKATGAVYVAFGSTSLGMVQRLRELLRVRLAIHAGRIATNNSGRKRALYSFVISRRPEVLKFAATVPLYGKKRLALEQGLREWRPVHDKDCSKYYRVAQTSAGCLETFDLEVDHPDHLFVLANGLIVSNSSKHSGGVAGAAKGVSGFKLVNQLVQVPATFKGGATHAELDGAVQSVEVAPQGGHYVTIGGERHYVAQGLDVSVRPGQEVEAGDLLSDGIPNPYEVVRHKGNGEGSRYFMDAFRQAYKDSGITAHRRNIEVLARGLINHVRMNQEVGDYVPGDVVPYHRLEHFYTPREGHELTQPRRALGMYLEAPVLHYSIGTKVRPSVVKQLEQFKVPSVVAHKDPPPFEPEMIRGMETLSHDPDWMTRFLGSYLKKNLLKGVHRGDVSDEHGTSYVPALAHASPFAREGLTRGFKVAPTTT